MAQSKAPDDKAHAHGAGWKEQQHKYTQTAKQMFEKFSEHAKSPKHDHAKVMEKHKKNLEALNHAHKKTAEVMKSISGLQSEFVKQTFEDMNAMMRGLMTQKPGQPIDLSHHSELMKNSLQRASEHAKTVGGVLSTSGKEIHTKMKDHFEEHKEELKEHFSKHSKH